MAKNPGFFDCRERSAVRSMAKEDRELFCKSSDGCITYTTDGSFIYAQKDGATVRLDLFAGHYYKLRPWNGVPILEIDGLRMHLVRDFRTPLEYSTGVVRGLKIPPKGDAVVLDTCMGLGYTAIAAAERPGVRTVVTCEVSPAVITLAKWSPFSDTLWEKGTKIMVMEGSAAELIRQFESSMFHFIIHDPPRMSHAPELYSREFYDGLYRVCAKGARIFHYAGSVGKSRGRSVGNEVAGRLEAAGFRGIRHSPRLQGCFAVKSR